MIIHNLRISYTVDMSQQRQSANNNKEDNPQQHRGLAHFTYVTLLLLSALVGSAYVLALLNFTVGDGVTIFGNLITQIVILLPIAAITVVHFIMLARAASLFKSNPSPRPAISLLSIITIVVPLALLMIFVVIVLMILDR